MADMVIRIQAEETGWHPNLFGQGLELRDGWAAVPEDQWELVRQAAGVVDFAVERVSAETFPELLDRRTTERGTSYPKTAGMAEGSYTSPPPIPVQPEPPSDTQVLNALLGVTE